MNKFIIPLFIAGVFAISAKSQSYPVSEIPENLLKNSNAVVRLDETKVTIEDRRTQKVETTFVITILNEQGKRYARMFEGYDPNTKIKELDALILDEEGEKIEHIKEKDFEDVSAVSGGTLYGDSRVKYANYTATSYPYTIVFTSEVIDHNTGFISTWYALSHNYVGVEKSVYTITAPADLGLRTKEFNLDAYDVTKEKSGTNITYSVSNILALKPEVMSPPDDMLYPKVMFGLSKFHLEGYDGDASSWMAFGTWMYNELLKETFDLPEETKQKMTALVADKPSTYEKAKAIYEYVQQNTRYISVQVGIGGWRPMKASEVDELGYGDCKALTNYTKNLLDAVGVTSYYSVIYGESDYPKSLEEDFVSIQGNHIILDIPIDGKDVWIDCTSQDDPFNYIGSFTDNRTALAITPEGGEMKRTTSYKNEVNKQIITANCTIDADGWLDGTVTLEDMGVVYDRFRISLMDSDEKEEYYKRYWKNLNNLTIDSIAFENDKTSVKFTEKITIDAPSIISYTGDIGLLIPNFFNNRLSTPERYRNRTTPFYIVRGFADEDTYTIELPENVTIDFIPDPVHKSNEFGNYEMRIEANGKTLVYHRKMSLNAGTYDKEKYNDFRNFIRSASKTDNAKVVLKKVN
ncbi:hypothetical protein NBRC110019_01680 [Neptunitalea chrysea]|uniref:DUF3857 domain-containing protein n=1 Tax=Neptunitalea chrysea TaxID=1647581 RepID=A0A9W6B2M8_9FLAO|nr:DUF3857 domain-containing protein [Neptunitalea chrysea]GLB51129.1 hypothetical protein NBRC110019_01680 [Neptunitalea chrysea]